MDHEYRSQGFLNLFAREARIQQLNLKSDNLRFLQVIGSRIVTRTGLALRVYLQLVRYRAYLLIKLIFIVIYHVFLLRFLLVAFSFILNFNFIL